MRSSFFAGLAGLTGLVLSQSIDLDFVKAQPVPTYKVVADQQKQTVEYNPATAIVKVVANVIGTPVAESEKGSIQTDDDIRKREVTVAQLVVTQQACDPIAGTLYGDLNGDSEDMRVQKFLSNATLQEFALNATTPTNYTLVFQNLTNSSEANGYLGYLVLSSYNVSECAVKCTDTTGCQAFNLYFERDPSAVPGPSCPNPPALLNPKCALWGGPVSADNTLNAGQYREQFHVVMTASNGYVMDSTITPFSTSAINAPLDCNGNDTYMGMRLLNDGGPFSPDLCAAICDETSRYSNEHPPEDLKRPPQLCTFYNTYVLYKNFVSQGQVCAMYSQSWDPNEYAKNDGQYDDQGNRFTISSSFFSENFSLPICPTDLDPLRNEYEAQEFCTSYISYSTPAPVTTEVTSTFTYKTCSTPTMTNPDWATTAATDTTTLYPSITIIEKREASAVEIVKAVVAVFPDKVADAAITGNVPAQVTIPANDLSVAGAYSSVVAEAISELSATESEPIALRTGWNEWAVAQQATPTPPPSVDKRQDPENSPTPSIFSGRDYREISSACSQIIDASTSTVTYYAEETERPLVDCSNLTTCANGHPPTLLSGSFDNSSYRVDDISYELALPFEVCIYDTCNSTIHVSSNGVITLGDFSTEQYDNEGNGIPAAEFRNETALFVYWDDLYIFPDQRHYISYSICGEHPDRAVAITWNVGHYIDEGPVFDGRVWKFSAVFLEGDNEPGRNPRVALVYNEIPDNGSSATIGAQGVWNGSSTFYQFRPFNGSTEFPVNVLFDYQEYNNQTAPKE